MIFLLASDAWLVTAFQQLAQPFKRSLYRALPHPHLRAGVAVDAHRSCSATIGRSRSSSSSNRFAQADPATRRQHRLQMLRYAIQPANLPRSAQPLRVPSIFHGMSFRHRWHTSCTEPETSSAATANSPVAPKVHPPAEAACERSQARSHPRQFGERNRKLKIGLFVGEGADITRLQPGLRHGPRIIGTDPAQVKTAPHLSLCFR